VSISFGVGPRVGRGGSRVCDEGKGPSQPQVGRGEGRGGGPAGTFETEDDCLAAYEKCQLKCLRDEPLKARIKSENVVSRYASEYAADSPPRPPPVDGPPPRPGPSEGGSIA